MRRLTAICATILLSLLAFARSESVVERSARKMPDWVYSMEQGYIITTAEGKTMAEARDNAMLRVKERIITSIAEQIASETHQTISETVTDSDIASRDTYTKRIRTSSANIPFLKDISEAYVKDYYWEKVRTKSGEFYYRYNLKYPFSTVQIRRAVREFQEQEDALNQRVQYFDTIDFAHLRSIEEMLGTIEELRALQQTLDKEDTRQNRCRAIASKHNQMLQNIQLRFDEVSRTRCTYHLCYGKHPITYAKRPKIESNCLTEIQWRLTDQGGEIHYNHDAGCYEEESNYLNVGYTLNGQKVQAKTYIH